MYTDPRAAYLEATVATASPTRLLLLLLERLELDTQRALRAQQELDHESAHHHLIHAQEIILELSATLRPESCPGGNELAGLYGWLYQQLVHANVSRSLVATEGCMPIIADIVQLWRDAASMSVATVA